MLPLDRISSPCGSHGWREAVIAFPPYHVDLNNQKLWRHEQACPLRPKAFGVLCHLLGRPGHLVGKKEILAAVWADTHVCDDVLKVCIQEIRSALMDDARTPRFIETVSRRGYRFIAEVARSGGARPPAPGGARRQEEGGAARAVPIGRGPELRRLHDLLDRVLPGGGRPEIALVSGEAGIGKSTLVDEFLRQAAAVQGVWIAQGQCVNHRGPGEAYMPVLEALGRLCRGPAGHQVVETLNRHAPAWLAQLSALTPCRAAPPRMLREFADAMEALPAPLILSLEDLQWSDPATLDLIGYLARRKMRAPLLLIGTCREEGPDGHPAQAVLRELHAYRLCTGLPVRPLRAEDVAQYLLTRFHGSIFSVDVVAQFHRSTDGNPLFLANLLDHLLQQGMLVPRNGQLALAVEPNAIAVTVPRDLKPSLDQNGHSRRAFLHARKELMPTSEMQGKDETIAYITENFSTDCSILDVGPGAGIYADLLRREGYQDLHAVEVFVPYVRRFALEQKYKEVYVADVRHFRVPRPFDVIIMGDILEHLEERDARAVIAYLSRFCRALIASVPWTYPQGEVDENPFERHLQPDLTKAVCEERYPVARWIFLGPILGVFVVEGHKDALIESGPARWP